MERSSETSVGVKVFTTSLVSHRARLGELVTEWLDNRPALEITDIVVKQSSDSRFHCLSIVVFYREPTAVL